MTDQIVTDNAVICCGPIMREHVRRPDGERWCFRCRTHRQFEYVVKVPVGESYYGPYQYIECGTCHLLDGDLFPGRFREWDE